MLCCYAHLQILLYYVMMCCIYLLLVSWLSYCYFVLKFIIGCMCSFIYVFLFNLTMFSWFIYIMYVWLCQCVLYVVCIFISWMLLKYVFVCIDDTIFTNQCIMYNQPAFPKLPNMMSWPYQVFRELLQMSIEAFCIWNHHGAFLTWPWWRCLSNIQAQLRSKKRDWAPTQATVDSEHGQVTWRSPSDVLRKAQWNRWFAGLGG